MDLWLSVRDSRAGIGRLVAPRDRTFPHGTARFFFRTDSFSQYRAVSAPGGASNCHCPGTFTPPGAPGSPQSRGLLLCAVPPAAAAQQPAAPGTNVPGEVIVRTGRHNSSARTASRSPRPFRSYAPMNEWRTQCPTTSLGRVPSPNDKGFSLQWNFSGPFGINMPEAWALATSRGAPGGRGAVVAVLDTGYRRGNEQPDRGHGESLTRRSDHGCGRSTRGVHQSSRIPGARLG
jgi:hypothetical protein